MGVLKKVFYGTALPLTVSVIFFTYTYFEAKNHLRTSLIEREFKVQQGKIHDIYFSSEYFLGFVFIFECQDSKYSNCKVRTCWSLRNWGEDVSVWRDNEERNFNAIWGGNK